MVSGTRLGPYEVLTKIGEGGMGSVYKARDTRLDRIVAVKQSADAFTERFERETRAIAALNNSHICQLYDVGPNYIVMEYVDGVALPAPMPSATGADMRGPDPGCASCGSLGRDRASRFEARQYPAYEEWRQGIGFRAGPVCARGIERSEPRRSHSDGCNHRAECSPGNAELYVAGADSSAGGGWPVRHLCVRAHLL